MKYEIKCKHCGAYRNYKAPNPKECKICGSQFINGITLWIRLVAASKAFMHPVRDYIPKTKKAKTML